MTISKSSIAGFEIGVSPIGTRPLLAFERTVISEYQNSPTLWQLISNFHDYIDPTENLEAFYDLIWNVDTAIGYGLDVWGRIVGVERVLQIPTTKFFGFQEGGTIDYDPYNQSPFWIGTPFTANYALSDSAFRVLILAKALANISDGSVAGINKILLLLFPGKGNCYVQDNLDMTLVYIFQFPLNPIERAVIVQSGVLPRPAGVSTTFTEP